MTSILAVVALVAAIPFASGGTSGGSPQTYTFTGDAAVCAGTSGTSFDVTLKNTSKTQNVGSADLYAPQNISLAAGSTTISGGGSTAQVTTYPQAPSILPGEGSARSLISLRSLTVPAGSSVVVHVSATVTGTGQSSWYSIVKQANQFNPGNLDTSNTFTLQGSNPTFTVSTCIYTFVTQPANALTGAAQTVKVQLWSGTTPVSSSNSLSLHAYQTTTQVDDKFTGLGPATQDATKTWVFSVTGNKSGTGYQLVAGSTYSNSFNISDCIPDGAGNCSTPVITSDDGSTAAKFSGTGIVSSGVNLSYGGLPSTGAAICNQYWGWTNMTFPVAPYSFDGITVESFSYQQNTGFLKMTIYFRNDLYVQTTANQTNDIQLCTGVKHTDPNANQGPFMGRDNTYAVWDPSTQHYWGVLARVPNCNKNPDINKDGILDPVLCAWGTVTLDDGLLYRSATVLIPYDWDIKIVP